MTIPESENFVLIRTAFSHELRWTELLKIAKNQPEPFTAWFAVLEDLSLNGSTVEQIVNDLPENYRQCALFIADERALLEDGFPCLVVGPLGEGLRPFRALARELPAIDANLSIGNMDYEEFEEATEADGIFRGFK